eukprot:TRINITY_DN3052_c0_g1_i1.p1 TRINITY_DN3052_c0_g1~~TRINITY_DN3052_c0_g1_i1.p1  ORF type:complete len:859 (-),score=115.07 TRINITY_DN3052_c0_g1_i1:112-2442(-)
MAIQPLAFVAVVLLSQGKLALVSLILGIFLLVIVVVTLICFGIATALCLSAARQMSTSLLHSEDQLVEYHVTKTRSPSRLCCLTNFLGPGLLTSGVWESANPAALISYGILFEEFQGNAYDQAVPPPAPPRTKETSVKQVLSSCFGRLNPLKWDFKAVPSLMASAVSQLNPKRWWHRVLAIQGEEIGPVDQSMAELIEDLEREHKSSSSSEGCGFVTIKVPYLDNIKEETSSQIFRAINSRSSPASSVAESGRLIDFSPERQSYQEQASVQYTGSPPKRDHGDVSFLSCEGLPSPKERLRIEEQRVGSEGAHQVHWAVAELSYPSTHLLDQDMADGWPANKVAKRLPRPNESAERRRQEELNLLWWQQQQLKEQQELKDQQEVQEEREPSKQIAPWFSPISSDSSFEGAILNNPSGAYPLHEIAHLQQEAARERCWPPRSEHWDPGSSSRSQDWQRQQLEDLAKEAAKEEDAEHSPDAPALLSLVFPPPAPSRATSRVRYEIDSTLQYSADSGVSSFGRGPPSEDLLDDTFSHPDQPQTHAPLPLPRSFLSPGGGAVFDTQFPYEWSPPSAALGQFWPEPEPQEAAAEPLWALDESPAKGGEERRTRTMSFSRIVYAARPFYLLISLTAKVSLVVLLGSFSQNAFSETQMWSLLVVQLLAALLCCLLKPFIHVGALLVEIFGHFCDVATAVCGIFLLSPSYLSPPQSTRLGITLLFLQLAALCTQLAYNYGMLIRHTYVPAFRSLAAKWALRGSQAEEVANTSPQSFWPSPSRTPQ